MPVIMGSAGHIDHGKTSLVRALTGIDCDRLEEEKRRGITIELGFAWCDLPGGERLGIVDVPGHERFVKNMVAGAAGIDFVMLVIAADEGVMPQTREHLEICSLLGIRHGLVALTKIDMADEEWLELVKDDIAAFVKGSFLENAPIYPVSSVTGQGIDELKRHILHVAGELTPRRRNDLFRLPIDRVFTMKGHGTVVTGTLISGSLQVGDDVVLEPSGIASKARGLQSYGNAAGGDTMERVGGELGMGRHYHLGINEKAGIMPGPHWLATQPRNERWTSARTAKRKPNAFQTNSRLRKKNFRAIWPNCTTLL